MKINACSFNGIFDSLERKSDFTLETYNPTGDENLNEISIKRAMLIIGRFDDFFFPFFFLWISSSSRTISWHATKLVALESVQPDNRNYSFNRSRVSDGSGSTIDDFERESGTLEI